MISHKEFPGPSGRIKDADRELILKVLAAMGVDLPPKSKMPTDALDKRLSKALNFSQRLVKNFPELPLDPTSLIKWDKKQEQLTLRQAMNRGNLTEAALLKQARDFGASNPFPLYSNTFMDIRQTLMCIGNNFDEDHMIVIMQDRESTSAIIMRIVDVYALSPIVPVIVVSFEHVTQTKMSFAILQLSATLPPEQRFTGQIISTIEEQKVFLKLLRMNAKHLSPSYKPKRHELEANCELSFLLPLGPLSGYDIGALTHNTGCAVCGDDTKMRCSGCLVQTYCSKHCQRADWSSHKDMCKSLAGGEWTTLTFRNFRLPDILGIQMSLINRLTPVDDLYNNHIENSNEVPPNIHGTHPFMIKIQQSIGGFSMLIYDRGRSFQVNSTPEDDQAGVLKIADFVKVSPTPGKIYRWAKRIDDYQLSICLDRPPQQTPTW